MLNQTVVVGRIVADLTISVNEDGKKVSELTIAIPRSVKNKFGEYETDFVDCTLYNGIAENTAEYCKKGDLVGVKGRLETSIISNEGSENVKLTKLVAEKVTFLSSKNSKDE